MERDIDMLAGDYLSPIWTHMSKIIVEQGIGVAYSFSPCRFPRKKP